MGQFQKPVHHSDTKIIAPARWGSVGPSGVRGVAGCLWDAAHAPGSAGPPFTGPLGRELCTKPGPSGGGRPVGGVGAAAGGPGVAGAPLR